MASIALAGLFYCQLYMEYLGSDAVLPGTNIVGSRVPSQLYEAMTEQSDIIALSLKHLAGLSRSYTLTSLMRVPRGGEGVVAGVSGILQRVLVLGCTRLLLRQSCQLISKAAINYRYVGVGSLGGISLNTHGHIWAYAGINIVNFAGMCESL